MQFYTTSLQCTTSPTYAAAMQYAREGMAVLPVCDKKPLTRNGLYDASADPEQIKEWWSRWPEANISIATGQASDMVALDADCGRAIKEAVRRGIPSDPHTVRTGRCFHLWFEAPSEWLRSFKLLPGLEVKAEGSYVVAPPSLHPWGTRYREWPRRNGGLDPLPDWILEAAREYEERREDGGEPVDADPHGPPIHEGTRNRTLFRVACSQRGRGADHASILAHLREVNRLRCSPALPAAEVEKVARSATRYKPGSAAPQITQEVHELLDDYTLAVHGNTWKGGGLTDHDVLLSLVELAHRYGTMLPAGVRVGISHRDLALATATSRPTLRKSIKRLKLSGWLRTDNHDRYHEDAGAFVLLADRANLSHSHHCGPPSGTSGKPMRVQRARWGGLGKKAAATLDTLARLGGAATVKELAAALGDPRPWELRRRQLTKLEQAGIIVLDGDAVMLGGRWQEALHEERELRGEFETDRADRLRYEEERRDFHEGRR